MASPGVVSATVSFSRASPGVVSTTVSFSRSSPGTPPQLFLTGDPPLLLVLGLCLWLLMIPGFFQPPDLCKQAINRCLKKGKHARPGAIREHFALINVKKPMLGP